MSTQDMGIAAVTRASGQDVSRPWVVMPPIEWPETPTPTAVSMWPAGGSPAVLRARVRVMTSETSLDWLPL